MVLGGRPTCPFGPLGIAAAGRIAGGAVELGTFGVDHVLERLRDLLGELVLLLGELFASLPEAFHHLTEPFDPLALVVLEPVLEETAERCGEVAVVEEVVGEARHDVVGSDVVRRLRAVEASVPPRSNGSSTSPRQRERYVTAAATTSLFNRRVRWSPSSTSSVAACELPGRRVGADEGAHRASERGDLGDE